MVFRYWIGEHRKLRKEPKGCSETPKPAKIKGNQAFGMEVIQLKNPETWANRGGVRKITDKLNNIKEYSERWINKYTSGERIETGSIQTQISLIKRINKYTSGRRIETGYGLRLLR